MTACTISHASKCLPLKSSFDCRFSFSAIAFRIIRTLHNIWSGNFSSDGQHTVKRKNLRQAPFPATAGFDDPFLLEVVGRCPPEDVGGPWGYEEFREAIADTNHERHHELVEWWATHTTILATSTPPISAKTSRL
ncbi:IS1096 element passenger TnpR family protein [Rhizobium ruizarguesonis]